MTDRTLKPVALKPCPFCGCPVSISSGVDWHFIIGDHSESCPLDGVDTAYAATPKCLEQLIIDWNRRTAPTDEEIRRIAEGVERAVYEWQVKGPAGGCLDVIKAAIRKVIC